MSTAPIFADAFRICQWLIETLGDDPRVLPRTICASARALLEEVALALKDRDRETRLAEADERLIALRLQLRMAAATAYLTEEQLAHAMAGADLVGRQLGGWRRTLG